MYSKGGIESQGTPAWARLRAVHKGARLSAPTVKEIATDQAVVAKEAVPGYGQCGSSTKITHLDEKLAPRQPSSLGTSAAVHFFLA